MLSNFIAVLLNKSKQHTFALQECVLCRANSTHVLCDACDAQLPRLTEPHCPQCAALTPDGHLCGACLKHPPHFDRVIAACVYTEPLAGLIQSYKYNDMLALAPLFASLLSTQISKVDCIVPLPLSRARLRERGFNQALEVARLLSNNAGISLATHLCKRVRNTAPQAALPRDARARNIRGAFVCNEDLSGKHIAIVDDVMTTGATLNEIAKTLKRAGAQRVEGWIIARAP